jgi:dolichol-phosphate mannosyltransferase
MLLSVVIPTHNECRWIEEVLARVRALPLELELILVDDGSTDGTREILAREGEKPRTKALFHEKNQGKGAAILTGLREATGDIVIIQDGDLEYFPEDIPSVIQPIVDGRANAAYGSRFLGSVENMQLPNLIANKLFAWMTTILYGQRITDEGTAYKAFRRELIQSLDLKCRGFEFCPEVTAKTLRRGERIIETPVRFVARKFAEGKKISFVHFFPIVWALLKYRFVS